VAERDLGGATLVVVGDADALAREAATRTVSALSAALAERGTAHVGLTGGSSAVPFFRELRSDEHRNALDWSKVHLWWVDERFVPTDHPDSNAGAAYRLLLGDEPGLQIDPANVHPVEVEETLSDDDPVELAAQLYARELNRFVPLGHGGVPLFDVLMTGVGPDGHILSLFPGSPGLAPDAPIALAVPAPEHVEPHVARVTLTARVLPVAGVVLVMSSGEGKASILAQVLGDDRDLARWPAQAALLPNAVWLLDRAAARGLRPGDSQAGSTA
jgi:6-phosphogluconolactonase